MKKIIYSLLIGTAIISCSRDEDPTTSIPPKQEDNIPLLPIEVGDIKYTYTEVNKLASIISPSVHYTFKYEGDLIKSMIDKKYNEETIFEYDNKQRLVNAYTTDGVLKTTYTYDNIGRTQALSTRKRKSTSNSNLVTHSTLLFISEYNGNVNSIGGWAWDDDPNTPTEQNKPYDVRIWMEYDEKENFAKNIKGIDKINLYLIQNNRFNNIGFLGNKNNVIHNEFIWNGFSSNDEPFQSGYSFESTPVLREYIYNKQDIAVGYRWVHFKKRGLTNNKSERGEVVNKDYIIKYNK